VIQVIYVIHTHKGNGPFALCNSDPASNLSDANDKLDPVGSTVRYEMRKLCTGSV